MIRHRLQFEDIDRETDSWIDVFKTVNDNYDKTIYRIEFEGRRFVLENIEVKKASTQEYFLSSYYVPWRNNLTIWIDGVRQYSYRDFTETNSASFILKDTEHTVYHSNLVALYATQENELEGYRVPESLIHEYNEASREYHDPKDRVRADLEDIIHEIMFDNKKVRDKGKFFLDSFEELQITLDYLDNYRDSGRYPTGDYYLTPDLDEDGTIRWIKSLPNIKKPKSRTFTRRLLGVVDGAIFIGKEEGKFAEEVVGSGVLLNDEDNGPHYGKLPISLGGTGGDNHASGRVTDLLVIDNHEGLTNSRMPFGVVNNTKEPDTIYNPGFVTGVLPVELGGTGVTETVSLLERSRIPMDTPLKYNLLSSVSDKNIIEERVSYSKYIGRSIVLPSSNPIYGDMEFLVVGVGRKSLVTEDSPNFTLIAKKPITFSSLSNSPLGRYMRYNSLGALQAVMNSIYLSLALEAREILSLARDILLDDVDEGKRDFGIMNPSNESIRKHYGYSIDAQHLWLPSLSEFDIGYSDMVIPSSYYEYFSYMALDKLMDIIGDSEGIWTRSQAPSEDKPRYYAIMRDGSVKSETVDTPMGICPLICI